MVVDADLHPSPNLYPNLLSYLRGGGKESEKHGTLVEGVGRSRNEEWGGVSSSGAGAGGSEEAEVIALVVPALQVCRRGVGEEEVLVPGAVGAKRLRELMADGSVCAFHAQHYARGHAATDHNRWLQAYETEQLDNALGGSSRLGSKSFDIAFAEGFEPYVVLDTQQALALNPPLFDARFVHPYKDKVSACARLQEAACVWRVFTGGYLLAGRHIPSTLARRLHFLSFSSNPLSRKWREDDLALSALSDGLYARLIHELRIHALRTPHRSGINTRGVVGDARAEGVVGVHGLGGGGDEGVWEVCRGVGACEEVGRGVEEGLADEEVLVRDEGARGGRRWRRVYWRGALQSGGGGGGGGGGVGGGAGGAVVGGAGAATKLRSLIGLFFSEAVAQAVARDGSADANSAAVSAVERARTHLQTAMLEAPPPPYSLARWLQQRARAATESESCNRELLIPATES
jgi:hypothetical protein